MKNNEMRQWFVPRPAVIAVLVTLAVAMTVPMAIAQSPAFNNGSLKGSYGFQVAKWTSDSSNNAEITLGLVTFDGAGNVSGSDTDNDAGSVTTATFSGTYSVKSNGTGSMSITSSGHKVTLALVIDGSGKNLQLMETDCKSRPCDSISSGTAVAQVSSSFSNASLKGAFGVLLNKWTPDPSQPAEATLGVDTFDGNGNMKVSVTDDTAGTITTVKASGTYSVNSDGTGSYALTDSKDNVTDGVFVINAAGKGYQAMHTTPCGDSCGNFVVSGTGTHQ